jgi:hypothetical protein
MTIVGLLLVTLGLTAALTWEAVKAERARREAIRSAIGACRCSWPCC